MKFNFFLIVANNLFFHDPVFGWGNGDRVGGMILDNVHDCEIIRSHADLIIPDKAATVLSVRIHTMAKPSSNQAAQQLLDYLNAGLPECCLSLT